MAVRLRFGLVFYFAAVIYFAATRCTAFLHKMFPFPRALSQAESITVDGIRYGKADKIVEVKPNERFVLTVFGANFSPDSVVWLSTGICDESSGPDKYNFKVLPELSYENILVLEMPYGVPQSEKAYHLCTYPKMEGNFTMDEATKLYARTRRSNSGIPLPLLMCLVLIATAMSALFSGVNLAFTNVAINELNIIEKMGSDDEKRLVRNIRPLREHLNWLICTFAMSNAFVNCFNYFAIPLLLESGDYIPQFEDNHLNFLVCTAAPTVVTMIFAEILPLAICNRRGPIIASKTRYITRALMFICAPIAWPLSKILDCVIGYQGCETYDRTKIEFYILEAARKGSGLYSEILKNTIKISNVMVSNVMTPIEDAFLLSTTDVLDYNRILTIVENDYSRIPIYEGTNRGKIVGVLNVSDLIEAEWTEKLAVIDVLRRLNSFERIKFVCREMQVMPLMWEMEGQNFEPERQGFLSHLAMVEKFSNKSYSLCGLITLDDIIEEIFGEMKDYKVEWTKRRRKRHRDQWVFDFLRKKPSLLTPVEEIYYAQEAFELFPAFELLSFNVKMILRLFQTCKIQTAEKSRCRQVFSRGKAYSDLLIMLGGSVFCSDEKGYRFPAEREDLGSNLLGDLFALLVSKGIAGDVNQLSFKPQNDVLVEAGSRYIKVNMTTVRDVIANAKEQPYSQEMTSSDDCRSSSSTQSKQSNFEFAARADKNLEATQSELSLSRTQQSVR